MFHNLVRKIPYKTEGAGVPSREKGTVVNCQTPASFFSGVVTRARPRSWPEPEATHSRKKAPFLVKEGGWAEAGTRMKTRGAG